MQTRISDFFASVNPIQTLHGAYPLPEPQFPPNSVFVASFETRIVEQVDNHVRSVDVSNLDDDEVQNECELFSSLNSLISSMSLSLTFLCSVVVTR
jgi:hypothetical protein